MNKTFINFSKTNLESVMENWVDNEFLELDLGDKRVDNKAKKIIDTLSKQPGASIPKAFNTGSEAKSCYEFFYNGKVTAEKILIPHQKATLDRIRKESVILIPQDTSSLNYSSKPSIRDLGNIGGPKNRGLFIHPLLGITPTRVNLGIIDVKIWIREDKEKQLTDHELYSLPIEEKEKFRWIEGYKIACQVAKECPNTQVITITDREGDFAELFEEVCKAKNLGEKSADIIVRSYHDRKLESSEKTNQKSDDEKIERKLRGKLKQTHSLGEIKFTIPATQNRPKREVTQSLKSATVTFKKRNTSNNVKNKEVTVNAVMAIEDNLPEGEEPLIWVFLTTLPINTFAEVVLIIEYYLARWEIEVFFKVLKSGCEVEDRRLKIPESLKPLIAIFLVVAWRIMYAMKLGRSCPEMSCETIFSASEWKSVYKVVNKGAKLPDRAPILGEFMIMVAKLGGYLNRKNDPPPGPKSIWIGINRMNDFAVAWDTFGNEN